MTRKRVRVTLTCFGLFALNVALVVAADGDLSPSGRPKQFEKGKVTAFAVWEDDGTWNLRTAVRPDGKGKGQRIQFTGRVTVQGDKFTNGQFQGLDKKARANEADWIEVHADGKGFDFQFSTHTSNTDGLTFKVGPKAESVTFKLLTAGDNDPKRVIVGAKGVHPERAEFTLPVK